MKLSGQFRSLNGRLFDKITSYPANTCVGSVHFVMDERFEEQMTRELFLEYFNKSQFEDGENIIDSAIEEYNFNKEL